MPQDEVKSRIGIDRAKGTYPAYDFTCRTMREFIETKFKTKDLAFGQLTEQFIHDYENFILDEKGYAVDTVRHYLAILKKTCKRLIRKDTPSGSCSSTTSSRNRPSRLPRHCAVKASRNP